MAAWVCAPAVDGPMIPLASETPRAVEVEFPVPGFQFWVTIYRFGETGCARAQRLALERTSPTKYRMSPVGVAGHYVVALFGRSGEGSPSKGDVSASFRWHTPVDGPNVPPSAMASMVSGSSSDVWVRGGELTIDGLRATPDHQRVAATALVTDGSGTAVTIPLKPQELQCVPEGTIRFEASGKVGSPQRTGPAPIRYEVTLVIDDVTNRGAGTGRTTWARSAHPARGSGSALRYPACRQLLCGLPGAFVPAARARTA